MTYMTPNYQVPAYLTAPAPSPSYNYNNQQQQQMLNYAPKTNYLAYAPTSNSYSSTYAPIDYSKHYTDNSMRQWNIDNSNHFTDNSNHFTDNSNHYADYSKYYTDNSRKSNFQNYQSYVDNSYVSNSYVYNPRYSNYSPSLSINSSKPQAYSTAYSGGGTDSYFSHDFSSFSNPSTYAVIGGGFGGGYGSTAYAGEYGKPNCHKGYHHPHGGYGGSSYGGGYGSTAYGAGSNALDIVKQLYPNGLMDPNTFFNS
jgi:hypothetical protein